jgi:hypothetical protein
VLIPVNEDAIFWYHPGLDRDLVKTWWNTENDYYFDFLHADGGFPDKNQVVQGPTVDLFEWQLKGIKKRGFAEKSIGVDNEWTPSAMGKIQAALPRASWKTIDDVCMAFRVVKTPEELQLWQRAYDYFSKIHAFARDYVLQHGTDLYDYQVGTAAQEYGVDLVMKDIKRDGRPHMPSGLLWTSKRDPESEPLIPIPISSITTKSKKVTLFRSPAALRSADVEANFIATTKSCRPIHGATKYGGL